VARLDDLVLFALGPSEGLGRAVAGELGLELAPHEERHFEDGEHKHRPLTNVRGRDVFVLASVHGTAGESVDDGLCRLLFFCGAVRDAAAGRVTVVAPYLCYARKDRKTNPRDPVTQRYVARLIEAMDVDRVVTMDVHNLAAYQNAFRIGTEHLEARPLFAARCRAITRGPLAVVSPDPGGFHRAEALRDTLAAAGLDVELAMLGKHRKGGVVRTEAFVGHVEGRTAVIVDDLVATGTTLVRAADACRRRGAAAVHAMATHALFTAGAAAALATPLLDSLTVTDTIAPGRLAAGPARDRLEVVPVAPMLARAIEAIHGGGSVSALAGA